MSAPHSIRDDCGVPAIAVVIAFAVLLVAAGSDACRGQEPPPAATVRETAPEIFYLRDDAGQLVPVPGFRYRDFVDLLRLREGMPGLPEPPAAVLENVTLNIDLGAGADEPQGGSPVSLTLTVKQLRSGWVSLPLELDGLVVASEPKHEGQGRFLLAADPRGRGYRGWFDGTVDARHTVVIAGMLAVTRSTAADTLRLAIPKATASAVSLRSPRIDPEVTVRPAMIEPRVEPAASGEGSLISCVGLSGVTDIRIARRERLADRMPSGLPAQAIVESTVRIDGRVAVTQATIRIENLAPEDDLVRITLPPRAALKAVRGPAILVERAGDPDAVVAVVRCDRDADGVVLIELECERPVDATGGTAFDPQGFSVEGIPGWRQRGRTSLVVEGDWQLEWDEPRADDLGGQRRTDPPSSARQPGLLASFAYDSQPASLAVRVKPRGSRIVVEPVYRYEIGATRVLLDARLRIAVGGAPISRIVIGLEGWTIDDIGPATLVDTSGILEEAGAVTIPFLQPLSGDAFVEIRCGRSVERDLERMEWTLPVPRADLVGPAEVVVTSESDIEVLPDADAIRGLVRQAGMQRGEGDSPSLVYRLDGAKGAFAASRRFLPRRVDAGISVQATVDESQLTVEQTLRFDVAHVPLEFLDLVVPEVVVRSGTLEIRQAGQLLNPFDAPFMPLGVVESDQAGGQNPLQESNRTDGTATAGDRPAAAAATRVRAMLPIPLLGSGELTLRFVLPTPTIPPETTVAEDLPLVMPAGVRIARQTFSLVAREQLAVDLRGDAWVREAGLQSSLLGRSWTAARAEEFVPLALSARQRSTAAELVVEAAWMETRLLPGRRDDSFTYAIATSGERISLSLPAGFLPTRDGVADPASVEVRLDGRLLRDAVRPDGRVVIELPRSGVARDPKSAWLLEFASSRDRSAELLGSLRPPSLAARIPLEAAVFPEGTLQRRFYWELRLESDEHVVIGPAGWTSQQRWEWGALGLERVPIVSREVLSSWVRANARGPEPTRQDRMVAAEGLPRPGQPQTGIDPPLAERRAVYAGVGHPGTAAAWAVPTWMLVLVFSGPVLAAGLAVLYRRSLRTTPLALAIAAGLALAASLMPDLAPLALQAALPGVGLAVLAALLRMLLDRTSGPARPRLASLASGNSSTRLLQTGSIVISPSAIDKPESVTVHGRNAS